ncbi:hypothetical protein [Actinomadura rudentiformis]|uniref:hypothetical protein n=1 Tax=Actinomadura rudentiformis TaxID=359158 RepID=UPI00178C3ACD|nr:hypothetical protein [Actinomadura rudentiformis]
MLRLCVSGPRPGAPGRSGEFELVAVCYPGRPYAAMSMLPDRSIAPENSAQKLLGVTPRTTGQRLTDISL